MKHTLKILGIALFAGSIFLSFVFLYFQQPSVIVLTQPISAEEFQSRFSGLLPLPHSASNVWYAQSSVGLGGRARMYRFDAPEQHLIEYAHRINRTPEDTVNTNTTFSLLPITESPEAVDHTLLKKGYGLRIHEWFDIENIERGWTCQGPPLGRAGIWIDTTRNRFYSYWTD